VTKKCCLELRRAWGFPPSSLHCAILESTWLAVTQNDAKVPKKTSQSGLPISLSIKPPTGQPENLTWVMTQGCSHLQNCEEDVQPTCLHCLKKLQTHEGQAPIACHGKVLGNCIVFPCSPAAGLLSTPENYEIIIDSPLDARHPAEPRNCAVMFLLDCLLDLHSFDQ